MRLRTWNDLTVNKVSGFSRVAFFASLSPPPFLNSSLLVHCRGGNGKEGRVIFPNY